MVKDGTESELKQIPIKGLSDGELAARWKSEGDVLARDLLYLRKWRAGDNDSGMELIQLYENYIMSWSYRFGLKREDDRIEVFQDVVLDLLERRSNLPELVEKSFAGYLKWRTRYAVQRFKANQASRTLSLEDHHPVFTAPSLEHREIIDKCKERLPPKESRIFDLRYRMSMTLEEIALSLESNVNAVGQRIFSLMRKMRNCLDRIGA